MSREMTRRSMRQLSRKWKAIDGIRVFAGLGTIAIILREMADSVRAAKEYVDAMADFLNAYGAWFGTRYGALVLLWACYILAEIVQHFMIEDAAAERYTPSGEEAPMDDPNERRWPIAE